MRSATASIVVGVTQQLLKICQANVPEPLVLAQPFVGFGERLWIEPAEVRASTHRPLDEPSPLERLYMLRRLS